MRTEAEFEELLRAMPPLKKRPPRAEPPIKPKAVLALAASEGQSPGEQIASVALEPKVVAEVRQALAGRSVRIGEDEVDFNKVTEARVTMKWTSPLAPLVREPVRSESRNLGAYNPFAEERMPGYEGE